MLFGEKTKKRFFAESLGRPNPNHKEQKVTNNQVLDTGRFTLL
jgi:hypothetical protein